MSKRKQQARKLRVGDVVRFVFGVDEVSARVVEDRGGLGIGGRQIVRIVVLRSPDNPVTEELSLEMPADECTLVKAASADA